MTDVNEVVIRQADLKEFSDDIQYVVNLTAQLESSREALSERCKELSEKYSEHPSLSLKPAQIKKVAGIIYKDSLNEERSKANELFDLLEALEEKE